MTDPMTALDSFQRELPRRLLQLQMRVTIAGVWAEEAPALMPISRPFDGFVEYTKRVSPTCLVQKRYAGIYEIRA